jgi:hypothetical protein
MGITQMYEYPGALALWDLDPAYVRCGSFATKAVVAA